MPHRSAAGAVATGGDARRLRPKQTALGYAVGRPPLRNTGVRARPSRRRDLAAYYDLPVSSRCGSCSDAKRVDEQAVLVRALWTLVSGISGGKPNARGRIRGAGLTSSLDFIAASDQVIDLAGRPMGGEELSEETLGVAVTDEVGPGGEYVTIEHTYRHFRREWVPALCDRDTHDAGMERGGKGLAQRAIEKVRRILATPQPAPPTTVEEGLSAVLERA